MNREAWVWTLLVLALIGLNCARLGGPIVTDDAFQYMSIAENIAAGNGIRTSIAHFDTERSHGELPAPITWFPAGYPALIALLSLVGIPVLWGGFIVSSVCCAVTVRIVAWLCSWYELSTLATRLVLLCLALNTWTLLYGGGVLSEAQFTALSIGAIAMLAAVSEQTGKPGQPSRIGLWALCGLLIGLACWARYAGLFLYGSLGLFLAIEVVFRRRRDLRGPIVAVVTATIPLAVLLTRNVLLVGNWRGGNSISVYSSLPQVIFEFVIATYEVLFGAMVRARLGFAEGILVLAAVVCVLLVARFAVKQRESLARGLKERSSLLPVFTYMGVYLAGLTYLSFFSHLGFDYRYCYPLLALLLLLIGLLVTLIGPYRIDFGAARVALASSLTLLGCYVFLNVRSTLLPRAGGSVFADRRIAGLMNAPTASGVSLRSWIEANIPADESIVAADGQATGHVLHRKTVSMVAHDNSTYNWGEPQVRSAMTRFDADFLILYAATPSGSVPQVQAESPFLGDLMQDKESPEWLRLAAENAYVKVFRLNRWARNGNSGKNPVEAP